MIHTTYSDTQLRQIFGSLTEDQIKLVRSVIRWANVQGAKGSSYLQDICNPFADEMRLVVWQELHKRGVDDKEAYQMASAASCGMNLCYEGSLHHMRRLNLNTPQHGQD